VYNSVIQITGVSSLEIGLYSFSKTVFGYRLVALTHVTVTVSVYKTPPAPSPQVEWGELHRQSSAVTQQIVVFLLAGSCIIN